MGEHRIPADALWWRLTAKPKVADLPDVDEPPLFQAEPQWDDSMLVDGPEGA